MEFDDILMLETLRGVYERKKEDHEKVMKWETV
jgi:hypothetical protein